MNNKFLTLLPRITLVIFGLFLFAHFLLPLEIEDNWWHLAVGRWIVQNHTIPRFDMFAFDKQLFAKWIDLQWLGQVFLYGGYLVFGEFGLVIFRALFFSLICILVFLRYRKNVPRPALFLVLLLLSFFLLERTLLRPLMFNFLFSFLFLSILFDYYEKRTVRPRLFLIPLLGVIWYNINGAALFFGLLVLLSFAFDALIQWFSAVFTSSKSFEDCKRERNYFLILLSVCVLYFLSLFITPYGLSGLLHYLSIMFGDSNVYHLRSLYIYESAPPVIFLSKPHIWFWAMILWVLFTLFDKRNKRTFLYSILFVSSFFMFLLKVRAVSFLGLVCSFIVCDHLSHLPKTDFERHLNAVKKFLNPKTQKMASAEYLFPLFYVVLMLFCSIHIYNKARYLIYFNNQARPYISPKTYLYPELPEVVRFMKTNNIEGNLFCNGGLGGYFLWDGFPKIRPMKDGRNINDAFIKFEESTPLTTGLWYIDLLRLPNLYWDLFTKQFNVQSALIFNHPPTKTILQFLNNHPDWTPVLVKGRFILFIKKGSFNIPPLKETLEKFSLSADSYARKTNLLAQFIRKKKQQSILERIFKNRIVYSQDLYEGLSLINLGFKDASLNRFLNYFSHPQTRLPTDQDFLKSLSRYFDLAPVQ